MDLEDVGIVVFFWGVGGDLVLDYLVIFIEFFFNYWEMCGFDFVF